MTALISLCIFGAFLLLLCTHTGEGMRCWQCSSDMDARCGDPFNMTHFALTDCDRDRAPYLNTYRQSTSVCKKSKQRTTNGLVIVRSCMWLNDGTKEGTCEENSQYGTTNEYCSTCNHDACNSAVDLRLTAVTLLPLGAVLLRSMAM